MQEENLSGVIKIKFGIRELIYHKVTWNVNGVDKGLRYGENPGQPAALYRLSNGNLQIGGVNVVQPGKYLMSNSELLQSGKHPGKINITDADSALNILRYFGDDYVVSIMKHNNPCGVAIGDSLVDAYQKANLADRVAAFGGVIALNHPCDLDTANAIVENYSEVVVAPDFEEGVMSIFEKKKNLRVMRVRGMQDLKKWSGKVFLDFKSLIDGGLFVQYSYVPNAKTLEDVKSLPLGYHTKKGIEHVVNRSPTEQEYNDMLFGWLVEAGVTSNSVIYVRDGVTLGIGTGEQDRVGVARIARDKAFEKARDRIAFKEARTSYAQIEDESLINLIDSAAKKCLVDSTMVSDAFFPFPDGAKVGLDAGVKAIIQPGGSINDYKVIEAVNEYKATMLFTKQRSFRH